ncbi:MAG: hypothetical protein JNL88_04925 [Bacteroidia bacterium]|nr:hypothetical protein [Bacteroidia bacterium]
MSNSLYCKWTFSVILLLLVSVSLPAQQPDPHRSVVVIEVRNFNPEKHLGLLNNALLEVSPESRVQLACLPKGWVLLSIDPAQIGSALQLENILKSTGLSFLIKEGADQKMLEQACGETLQKF